MYEEMIETSYLKILLKSFHENYSDLFKKNNMVSNLFSKGFQCHLRGENLRLKSTADPQSPSGQILYKLAFFSSYTQKRRREGMSL